MRFATEKEVLGPFRLLSEKEASRRRKYIAIITGVFAAILSLLSPLFSFLFLVPVAVILADKFVFGFLFERILAKNKDSGFDRLIKADDENNKEFEGIFENNRRTDKTAINFKLYFFVTLLIAASLMLLFYGALKTVPLFVRVASSFLVVFFFSYKLLNLFIKHIEQVNIPEFPEKIWHKFLAWMLLKFSDSKGAYVIGEVNGKRVGLPGRLRFLHTLIIGPTGEEKTSSFFTPQLLYDASSPASTVTIDAKSPNQYEVAAGRWIAEAKRVFLFDPWHPDTVGINFLPSADDEDLLIAVETLTKEREEMLKPDPFFMSRTKYLLFAMLKLVQTWKDEYCNLASVYYIAQSYEILDAFIAASSPEIKQLFADYQKLSNESKVNALTSIRDKLDIFMDPAVRKAFSRSDFSLNMLFEEKKPCLLIIGASVDKEPQSLKIASLLANLISNLAFKERRLQKIAKQRGEVSFTPPDVYMYLDELRKLKIIRLPDLVSIARETRIHIIGSITDIGFFKYYGQDFTSLMTNFRTKIVLGGLDIDSATYISKSLGKKYKPEYALYKGGTMVRGTETDLLPPSDVQGLPIEKAIVFPPITKVRPFPASKISIYRTDWVKKMQVPPPKDIREKYSEWGLSIEPLTDPCLPKIQEDLYDFAAIIDREKRVEVNPQIIDRFFVEQGGGKFFASETDDTVFMGNIIPKDIDGDLVASL